MCIFRAPRPGTLPGKPTIEPRVSQQAKSSRLPEKKELLDPDKAADVAYGSQKKKESTVGKKTGTSALKIPLNTATTGSTTGGLNV